MLIKPSAVVHVLEKQGGLGAFLLQSAFGKE